MEDININTEQEQKFEETNITTLWLHNIYENLQNLEHIERIAREGCESIMEYLQIPSQSRKIEIIEAQYKNLKMLVSEFKLTLNDISPVVSDRFESKLRKDLVFINLRVRYRKNFIKEERDDRGYTRIINMELKEEFYNILEKLSLLRLRLTKEIAPLLFVPAKSEDKERRLK